MLRAVDSSLLDEWEQLRDAGPARSSACRWPRRPPRRARWRTTRAPSPRACAPSCTACCGAGAPQYEEALALLRPSSQGGGEDWTAESLAAALAPYWAEHASIDVTPRARRPSQTLIKPAEPGGTFTARQRLLDPAEDEDWMIDCFVDARTAPGDGPLIELRGIGR